MTGSGVYTTVDGDACEMEPGDLILTPNWMWHDHNNYGDEPMVWFDGLDLPLMVNLESVFFENHPDDVQPVVGHNISQKRFAAAGLVEAGMESPEAHSPLLRYPWGETDRALSELYDLRGGPIVALEYRNPVTGGPVVSTFGCEIHRVYPGTRTVGKRKVGSSVYVVFRGSGRSVIGGQAFDWGAGDVFVVPSWVALDHEAHESSDLFVLTDAPVLKALHQYREEVLSTQQPIERVFDPR
jgi:gentisate 1,2-dioxygenase